LWDFVKGIVVFCETEIRLPEVRVNLYNYVGDLLLLGEGGSVWFGGRLLHG
jgi:hypothetical protein